MKSSKFVRGIFGLILSCFVIVGITSCEPPSGGYSPQINYLAAVDGVPDEFLGTWENNDWGHSEYILKKNQINDVSMGVIYNVVSDTTVTSDDKYILIFCQVAKDSGTQWTPSGYFYVAAVKKNNTKIDICCVVDPSSVYKTIDELKIKYTAEYSVTENRNFYTTCDFVPKFRTPVEGVPDEFTGTIKDPKYGSQYNLTKTQIIDVMMSVTYNVISDTVITSADGCALIFCQVAQEKGTAWTPEGNFYVVAIKKNGEKIDISCPIDYSIVYESPVQLQRKYTSSYNVIANGNFFTSCDPVNDAPVKVVVTSMFGFKIEFEKENVSLYQLGVDGYSIADSFKPVKGSGIGVDLYLRSLDYAYQVKIKTVNGERLAVFSSYDEDDEDEYEGYEDMMPTVSDNQLSKILALYE